MDWLTDSRSLGKDGRKEESRWPLTQVEVIQRSVFLLFSKLEEKKKKMEKEKKEESECGDGIYEW